MMNLQQVPKDDPTAKKAEVLFAGRVRVSETFLSLEGEGPYTGYPTLFIRFFGCNFTCSGLGTKEPATAKVNALKYASPETREDLSKYQFTTGCDSAYSWDPAFKHLTVDHTVETLAKAILQHIEGKYMITKPILCFTGGEPMLYQKYFGAIWELVKEKFSFILIETNASIKATNELWRGLEDAGNPNLVWSLSPKLSNSGEPRNKAISKEVVDSYYGQKYWKFVSDGSEESLVEIRQALDTYSGGHTTYANEAWAKTWLMPEGASLEQQNEMQRKVAALCLKYGIKFCARVHVWIWKNEIGT
jgi:organic radical activating enzyme